MKTVIYAIMFAVAIGATTVNAGLIAHLKFDNAADLGYDSSGNGNHAGVYASAGFSASGISGGAADLTSNNGYFNFWGANNPVVQSLDGAFTYSIWINTTQTYGSSTDATYQGAGIIYADVYGLGDDAIPMALVGSQLGVDARHGDPYNMRSISDINTGQWVHLVVTRDPETSVNLYVNGVLEDSETSGSGILSERGELVLGGNLIDSRYFNGLMDDFQAYTRPLSETEVQFLYNNAGSAVPEPSSLLLVGFAAVGLIAQRRRRS